MAHVRSLEVPEILHKVCGGLEVAHSLVERAGLVYRTSTEDPDATVVVAMIAAQEQLARALEQLQQSH